MVQGFFLKSLVVVESPAKAKTIQLFLGPKYIVKATKGQVRDLPKSRLGVDLRHKFKPEYVELAGQSALLKELRSLVKGNSLPVYLATDRDREGESISWHLSQLLGRKSKKREIEFRRAVFNEITASALKQAFKKWQLIDLNKVYSQQARRVLDRLVGYKVSPLLWKNVRRGLSAGRVQSVALRLICEREEKIKGFVPEEYWVISATLRDRVSLRCFTARLERIGGKSVKVDSGKGKPIDKKLAHSIVEELKKTDFVVGDIKKKEEKRTPPPPFITSQLQQTASSALHFTPRRTMRIAQQLYEGIELGKGERVGLITYMRTDSVRVAGKAVSACRSFIKGRFGEQFLNKDIRTYKSKRVSQEAHEAIRPVDVKRDPASVKGALTPEQLKLYGLIYNRFVATQMAQQVFELTSVKIKAARFMFSSSWRKVKFPGFGVLYADINRARAEDEAEAPSLSEADVLDVMGLEPAQHFTKPPPRFSAATLIKVLEENGIGRPSTYVPTISVIQNRSYVVVEEGRIVPTELGMIVVGLLIGSFPGIFNVEFTSKMEEELDKVEEGKKSWEGMVKDFYAPFSASLKKAVSSMENKKKALETELDEPCPDCKAKGIDSKLVIKFGRYGDFIACPRFPDCRYSRPVVKETGVACPEEKCPGRIIERKTKRGKPFYGCSEYPSCKFAVWGKPYPTPCPQCGAAFLVERGWRGRRGKGLKCATEGCGYSQDKMSC